MLSRVQSPSRTRRTHLSEVAISEAQLGVHKVNLRLERLAHKLELRLARLAHKLKLRLERLELLMLWRVQSPSRTRRTHLSEVAISEAQLGVHKVKLQLVRLELLELLVALSCNREWACSARTPRRRPCATRTPRCSSRRRRS